MKRKTRDYNALPYEWEPEERRRMPRFVTVRFVTVDEAAFIRDQRERRTRRAVMWILALAFSLALVALALLLGGTL